MNFFSNLLEIFKKLKLIYKIIIICVLLILIACLSIIIWYKSSIKSVSRQSEKINITIDIGSSKSKIADILKENDLIKNNLAFKIYIKLNNPGDFQAGNYELDKTMSVEQIVSVLQTGVLYKEQVSITFVEGKNMRWIAKAIEANTDFSSKDVFTLLKDEKYIDSLINEYWFLTDEIKNKDIYYPLEGYLFPDTYSFDKESISIKEIFKTMLDEMDKVLSSYNLKESKYTVHEILSLASIVELEGVNEASRKDIASVLFNRLDANMSLGSDVTTYYAYKVDMGERDLTTEELYTYNPYNTRGPEMFGKLPVGPICSPSKSSIEAVINPNSTNYLYFVADKNSKIYFASTIKEHEKNITYLKNNDLWFEY